METYDQNASSPTSSTKRQRAKHACEPCRLRKRKCDGASPCNMCRQFEYTCYYEKHPRKRSKKVEQRAIQDGRLSPPQTSPSIKTEYPGFEQPNAEELSKQKALEANSGIAFTHLLSSRLDPSSGPKLLTSIGWNLGSEAKPSFQDFQPITDLLRHDQMVKLSHLYFKNVHPLYGLLDQEWILTEMNKRWSNPEACNCPDHLLAGVASCGTLFSDGSYNHLLPALLSSAKLALEGTSTVCPPTLHEVQSWVLRSLYLRGTDHPHAVWMASCTVMHLIESMGLHQETQIRTLRLTADAMSESEREIRRRTFWVARMLNTWVSFEYGRTRVTLRGVDVKLPTPLRDDDYTLDYVQLYSLSCCLDPERVNQANQWEEFLRQLEAFNVRADGIELSRANLGMCGYRRIRLASPNLSSDTINRIIRIGLGGLQAARRMMEKGYAWWHVVNVPFQVVCVFLAMDVRESLQHIATAMQTLEDIVRKFRTHAMKEALKTARFLVKLTKKRKDEDSEVLAQSLSKASAGFDPRGETDVGQQRHGDSGVPQVFEQTPGTTASSEDWNLDFFNGVEFDWKSFLTADIPAFNSFAPDGAL